MSHSARSRPPSSLTLKRRWVVPAVAGEVESAGEVVRSVHRQVDGELGVVNGLDEGERRRIIIIEPLHVLQTGTGVFFENLTGTPRDSYHDADSGMIFQDGHFLVCFPWVDVGVVLVKLYVGYPAGHSAGFVWGGVIALDVTPSRSYPQRDACCNTCNLKKKRHVWSNCTPVELTMKTKVDG